jgi:hypothetical protein
MMTGWIRLLRAGTGAFALALLAVASHAQKPKEPWDYLNEPVFKSAYTKALGPKAKLPWLAKRDGPAPLPSFIELGGERYVMNQARADIVDGGACR